MKFEERNISSSVGWCLAHSLTCNGRKIGKATAVTAELADELLASGIKKAQLFQLDPNDLDEDAAAHQATKKIAGSNIRVEPAGRGRTNLIASRDGLFVPGKAIDRLNALDDAFSAASKAPFSKVAEGDLIATIKLIPYGLPAKVIEKIAATDRCEVKPFSEFAARLIVSCPKISPKTVDILKKRLAGLSGTLHETVSCSHTTNEIAAALENSSNANLILMLGASAISDLNDILPASVIKAGGEIIKLGMPADPGNLLMVAILDGTTVIGMPGCARSPALNGFDWILERFAAGLPLDSASISAMGTGGLLKEPAGRRAPRNPQQVSGDVDHNNIAAIMLAAGKSSRSAGANKLLSMLGGKPVIRTTAEAALNISGGPTFVVTGAHHRKIARILHGLDIIAVQNTEYDDGMGTSIAVGIKALPDTTQFALLCLGDMPFVQAQTYQALVSASQNYGTDAIFIPTFHGKRGHPVLWGKRYFRALSALTGDIGGRDIVRQNAEKIIEIPVDDPGILIDLDTPEMLAGCERQFGVTPVTP